MITNYINNNLVELLVMRITGAIGITGIVGSNASMMVEVVKKPTLYPTGKQIFPVTRC